MAFAIDSGETQKLRVFHFGDSHIQPDNFTGEIRRQVQAIHGNGGRGVIYPYTFAKTNGPKDFTVTSDVQWLSNWNINYPHKFQLGLAGMSIKSTAENGYVLISLKKDTLSNPYTKAILYYSFENKEAGRIALNKGESKTGMIGEFDTISVQTSATNDLRIDFSGSKIIIHAIYFENDQSGVVYSSIGVAGARYQDFNRTAHFFDQYQVLDPDVVVISLGTNESYDPKYNERLFQSEVDSLITKLKALNPNVEIILTLPSENYRVKNGVPIENNKLDSISAILRMQAEKHNCAIWDLKKAMGGNGSMLVWYKEGFVNKDHVHYLKKGYNRQGVLFFNALESFINEE